MTAKTAWCAAPIERRRFDPDRAREAAGRAQSDPGDDPKGPAPKRPAIRSKGKWVAK